MSRLLAALRELGIDVMITTMPCEIADCIPFEQDTLHAAYDADYANRFWRVLVAASEVMAISALRFSASRARCISSGAVSIWR